MLAFILVMSPTCHFIKGRCCRFFFSMLMMSSFEKSRFVIFLKPASYLQKVAKAVVQGNEAIVVYDNIVQQDYREGTSGRVITESKESGFSSGMPLYAFQTLHTFRRTPLTCLLTVQSCHSQAPE